MNRKEHNDGLDASYIINQTSKRNRELQPYSPDKVHEQPNDTEKEKDDNNEEQIGSTVPKEENRRRKNKGQDYENLFIRDTAFSTRNGKTVYIRKEFHDRILRIIQVIGYNKISLFSYLDNVLEHHFNTFQEDISELYNKRNPHIF